MVADAVAVMAEPGAALRKVVLSRPVEVRLSGPLPLSAVLRRLRAGEPNCTIFSMPVPDGSFFGASPELLVARHGTRVSCHPLAGTVPRGDTARTDADAQRDLAGSAKNRAEHRYVVDDIAATLRPFCAGAVGPGRALRGRLPLGGPPRARGSRAAWPGPGRPACSSCSSGSIPRRPWAARHAPRPWPSSPPTRRAGGATGPARWVGSAPTATGSG